MLTILLSEANGSVPLFYQALLLDMRTDLDTLTSDLHSVTHTQLTVNNTDDPAAQQSPLS